MKETTPVGSIGHAHGGLSRAASLRSLKTADNEPALVFALTIDDLNGVKEANTNIWDELMERELQQPDSDLESEIQSLILELQDVSGHLDKDQFYSPKVVEEREKLIRQWDHIVKKYIIEDASEQINISNISYREIMNENESVTTYHTPNALWRAKNEILQLIKENAYISFCKKIQKTEPENRCEALGIRCKEGTCGQEKIIQPSLNPIINTEIESGRSTPATKSIATAMKSSMSTPISGSPQHASPVITPVHSNGGLQHSDSLKVRAKGLTQGRLRQLASPKASSHSSSGSASPSSLSAFLGHLKISTGSGSSTGNLATKMSSIETSGIDSSLNSQNSSVSTSPVLLKKTLTNELPEESSRRKLRLWKNKASK